MYTRKKAARAALLSLGIVLAGMLWHPWPGWASWHTSTASTYGIGDGFLGGSLACGGTLDAKRPVVAHKTLPCGTRVAFRYGRNAAVGVVRDRGPYVAGRDWDLGPALERELGFSCGVCSLSWRLVVAPPGIPDVQGIVTSTADGDTYHVLLGDGSTWTVRALGIDTPEIAHPGLGIAAECGGQHAADIASGILTGKRVILRGDPVAGDTDRYHRRLRYVFTGSTTFQARLVRAGLAKVYEFHGQKLRLSPRWHRLQTTAAAKHRATWGDCPAADAQAADFTHAWSTGPAA